MAIPPDTKSPNVILRSFKDRIQSRTGVTKFDSDSKVGAILDIVTDELVETRNQSIQAYYNNQLTRANGEFLDRIGRTLGLDRFNATYASSNKNEQNLAFFVESGTFGDINGAAPFVIPAGTIISSVPNQNELNVAVEYEMLESVVIPASGAIAFVSVRSKLSGSQYNVGEGVLSNHNFTDYTLSSSNLLKVVNFYAILNGRDRENDDRYRFRLSKNYDRLISTNDTKIKLSALNVPGVLDVKVVSNYYGIGTVGAIVLGADYSTSNAQLKAVQANLDEMKAPGLKVAAVAATKVSIDIELEIEPTRPLTSLEKQNVRLAVTSAITNQLRSSGIGGIVEISSIVEAIRRNAPVALKVGRKYDNSFNVFSKIYLRRGFASGFSSERELLVGNSFSLNEEEFADLGTLTISYRS
jgi:uncharacterized phage protein gp47/JayE